MTKKRNVLRVLSCHDDPIAVDQIWGAAAKFVFVCDREWSSLDTTEVEGVRNCDNCKRHVFACNDPSEAEAHAKEGHCIAEMYGLGLVGDLFSEPS